MVFYSISNAASLFAQETFFRTFSSNDIERGTSLIITSENHLIITGTSTNASTGNTQIIVIKTDMDGKILWTRKYGNLIAPETNVGLVESRRGNFALSATTHQAIPNDLTHKNAYTCCIDKEGKLLWENLTGSVFDEEVGGIIAVQPESNFFGDFQYFLIGQTALLQYSGPNKTLTTFGIDTLGSIITNSNYSQNYELSAPPPPLSHFRFNSFIESSHNRSYDAIIGNIHHVLDPNNINSLITNGLHLTYIENIREDVLYKGVNFSVSHTPSEYITVGYSTSHGNGSQDIWVCRFTDWGTQLHAPEEIQKIWEKVFSTSNSEVATDIHYTNTNKNEFIIAGHVTDENTGDKNQDVFLMKIDREGNLLWSKTYPQNHLQNTPKKTSSLAITIDGSIYLVRANEKSFE